MNNSQLKNKEKDVLCITECLEIHLSRPKVVSMHMSSSDQIFYGNMNVLYQLFVINNEYITEKSNNFK